MRGAFVDQGAMFSYISLEERIPANHPLRQVRALVRDGLKDLSHSLGRLSLPLIPSGPGTGLAVPDEKVVKPEFTIRRVMGAGARSWPDPR